MTTHGPPALKIGTDSGLPPRCERSSTLYWVDCLKRELWAYRPERQRLVTPGGVRLSADVCNTIGSIGLAEGGGLVMASRPPVL